MSLVLTIQFYANKLSYLEQVYDTIWDKDFEAS